MNPHPNDVLYTAVAEQRLQLQACEEQSKSRLDALECILYATQIPQCSMCLDSMNQSGLLSLLRTKCKNIICIGCWRHVVNSQTALVKEGLPKSPCPFRSCTNNGVVVPCSIESGTTNKELLFRIALTRKHLETRFQTLIHPNPFSDVKPFLLSKMDFPDKRQSD